jgi:DNA-binding SARP family transcriptional activator
MGAARRERLQFRLLGPLEACREGGPLRLGGERQRALLALLLVHANELVRTEALVDVLFGGERSGSAVNAARVAVSRLRRVLEDGAERGVIQTRPGGYVLRAEAGQLDAVSFERLVREGHGLLAAGDAANAAARLRQRSGCGGGRHWRTWRWSSTCSQTSGGLRSCGCWR